MTKEQEWDLERCKATLEEVISKGETILEYPLNCLISDIPLYLVTSLAKAGKANKVGKGVQKIVHLYCRTCVKLLSNEIAITIPQDLLLGVLRAISTCVALFKEYPILRKSLLKLIISLWSSWNDEQVRIVSLLAIHALCSKYSSLLDTALKKMYQQYGQACKSLNARTSLTQASLLINGLVEIFTLNPTKSVDRALSSLRQLANSIQQVIKHPGKDTVKRIFSWKFISLVRFWCQLLSCDNIDSQSPYITKLLAPLGGIICCLLSLPISPRHYPYFFHLVAATLTVMKSRQCFFPLSAVLLRIIAQVSRQPLYKMESTRPTFDLITLCKVSKFEITSKTYLEAVLDEAFYYLFQLSTILSPIALPEATQTIITSLKRITQSGDRQMDRNVKQQITGHLSKFQQQAREIARQRMLQSLTPLASSKSTTNSVNNSIVGAYLENLKKIRLTKRKLVPEEEEASKSHLAKIPRIKTVLKGSQVSVKRAAHNGTSNKKSSHQSTNTRKPLSYKQSNTRKILSHK